MCGASRNKQKCTRSLDFGTQVKEHIFPTLQTDGRFHMGTLVFEEGPKEPFGSLTMLDLWLSAKSKLQWGGNRLQAGPISTLPSALFRGATATTNTRLQFSPSSLPLARSSSSLATVEAQRQALYPHPRHRGGGRPCNSASHGLAAVRFRRTS